MSKQIDYRKSTLAARDTLSMEEIQYRSAKIASRLLQCEEITGAENIFIYVSFRSEVATLPIIRQLMSSGKQVSVPLTQPKEKRLDIVLLKDPDTELEPGYYDIPEPRRDLLPERLLPPEVLDTIILPGSVFDERCGRFGYGGGFYDRLLSSIPEARRIALAFELQIIKELPLKEHDELLDCVVTEKRIVKNRERSRHLV